MHNDQKMLLKEAKRLIRIHSVTTESNRAIARHVGRLLKEARFKVRYQMKKIGGIAFYNVIGQKGTGKNPLIFMTHLDTVPPGPHRLWTKTGKDPWNPRMQGHSIYGLGSADTKLDILSKIFAARDLPVQKMKHPLLVIGTFGEERGLLGARHFCERIGRLRGIAFVSEPTELTWVHEHKGYLVLELSFPLGPASQRISRLDAKRLEPEKIFELKAQGKSAHSSTPQKGRNAIRLAFAFLKTLSRQDPSLKLLSVEGGVTPNQVPSEARLVFTATFWKFPRHPFIKIRRLKKGIRKQTVPWEALFALFKAVDSGIRKRKRPMTSTVGWIRQEGRFLKVTIDFRVHPKDKNEEVLLFFKRIMKKTLSRHRLREKIRVERSGPSLSVPPKCAITQLARRASHLAKEPFRLIQKPTCTEAGYLWGRGIPALIYGSGKAAGNIHAPNEYNDLKQMVRAGRLYKVLMQSYCLGD